MINPQTINAPCIMQLPKNKRKFEKALVESINETFASFGPNCAEALYYHLEETFRIKKQDIPNKIEEFADAIEQMFGVSARLIEIRIMEALHERVSEFVHFPRENKLLFTEYVASLGSFMKT